MAVALTGFAVMVVLATCKLGSGGDALGNVELRFGSVIVTSVAELGSCVSTDRGAAIFSAPLSQYLARIPGFLNLKILT